MPRNRKKTPLHNTGDAIKYLVEIFTQLSQNPIDIEISSLLEDPNLMLQNNEILNSMSIQLYPPEEEEIEEVEENVLWHEEYQYFDIRLLYDRDSEREGRYQLRLETNFKKHIEYATNVFLITAYTALSDVIIFQLNDSDNHQYRVSDMYIPTHDDEYHLMTVSWDNLAAVDYVLNIIIDQAKLSHLLA